MNVFILLKTAVRTIRFHAGRSILTVLGIMIGISAIVITFAIGRGAEEKIKSQIMWMGERACYVISGAVSVRGAARSALFKPIRLTVQDMQSIKAQVPEIQEISRGSYTLEMIEYAGNTVRDRVMGSDANIFKINKNQLELGICFTEQHVLNRVQVAVLGEKIAQKLFIDEFPVGKTIRISGKPFTVLGVVAHQEHFFGPEDPNLRVYVPFTVAKKFFSKEDELEDDLSNMAIGFRQDVSPKQALQKIRRILRMRHNLAQDEPEDFLIIDQASIAQAAQDAANVIKLFGLLAASISLIVGGIGVMNVMLVSVRERTQEIGLRIAIGATRTAVQIQFLLESLVLCVLGGIIGIFMGLVGLLFIKSFTDLSHIIEFTPLAISFWLTIVTGIFFGYYPAYIASQLNPIDALLKR